MINFIYNDGGRKNAGFSGKAGDCVCRAICIASGRDYNEVYEVLSSGNKTQRKSKYSTKKDGVKTASHGINTNRKWFKDYMNSIGFEWVPTMKVGQGCKVHLREDELPKGKLVVSLSRHYAAVIDGVLHDISDCSRFGTRCVYGYWMYKG